VHGVSTNRDLLVRVLRHPSFLAGRVDTTFLERHPEVLVPLAGAEEIATAALAAALATSARGRPAGTLPAGWRNLRSAPATAGYEGPQGTVEVAYRPVEGVVSATGERVVLERDGVLTGYAVHAVGSVSYVDGPGWTVRLSDVDPLPEPVPALPAGSLTVPMPGVVREVLVAEGDRVSAGQPLLVLEAMKMDHPLVAPAAGIVTELRVDEGAQVPAGAVVAVVAVVAAVEED
jgi:propionyl-CoA carboxylase alpha chain